jgi:hypothetical protein
MLTSGSIANQLHGNAVAVVAREMVHWTRVVLAQTRPFVTAALVQQPLQIKAY